MPKLVLPTLIGITLVLAAPGCSSPECRPQVAAAPSARNPTEAERLTKAATQAMAFDPEHAEALLVQAIAADEFHGPAHNNLGVLHFTRGDLHAAAREFELAGGLIPGHPDPRLNLALTLERAGRFDDAISEYEAALQLSPHSTPTLQALTRCRLRHSTQTLERAALEDSLQEIAIRGTSPKWRQWAQSQLSCVQ